MPPKAKTNFLMFCRFWQNWINAKISAYIDDHLRVYIHFETRIFATEQTHVKIIKF